jgi:hypothetical protein
MLGGRLSRGGAEERDDSPQRLLELDTEHLQDVVGALAVESAAMGLETGWRAGRTDGSGKIGS